MLFGKYMRSVENKEVHAGGKAGAAIRGGRWKKSGQEEEMQEI